MASKLGTAIAAWLATRPGPIRGDTQEDCLIQALHDSKIPTKLLAVENPLGTFAQMLDLAGYKPVMRNQHGKMKDGSVPKPYWLLCLPERQAGSHR